MCTFGEDLIVAGLCMLLRLSDTLVKVLSVMAHVVVTAC